MSNPLCYLKQHYYIQVIFLADVYVNVYVNEMLHICSLYADNFDITFNSKKLYV